MPLPFLVPRVAAPLGVAYARSGRVAEGLPLLEQAVEQQAAMRAMGFQALWVTHLSEAYLLAGRRGRGHAARPAGVGARPHRTRNAAHQAWALRLLGEVAAHADCTGGRVSRSTYYHQALALAEELGMRPLQAHCHRGLGTLYAATGQREQACTALSTAIEMYTSMDMTFWLPQTEAARAQVEGR